MSNVHLRTILHVDLNSFFAMAEQQTNPAIRNKPVGVIKAEGRSCIIAASPEAKRMGVGTGSRVYDAKKLCPGIILVPANFDKYSDISRRFIKICASYSPYCEVFSIDECFIDVTEVEKFFGTVFNIAYEIKDRIRREIGDYLTVSIGVSHNKYLAKLASGKIKPDGLFWITEDNKIEVLNNSNLMDVCGLGWRLYSHLTSLGIDNFKKLRTCSLTYLFDNFGPYWSVHLYNLARGIDNSPVVSFSEVADAKSVGRTYTTHRLLTKRNEIFRVVRNLCEEATGKARQMGLCGRYVGLMLRAGTHSWSKKDNQAAESWWGHRTLKNYIDDGKVFFELCEAISRNWDIKSVIFVGVFLGMLTKKGYMPLPLFNDERKRSFLTKATDAVNEKYGDYTVYPAQLLGMPIVMPEVTGFFGDKKFQLNKFKALE